MDLAQAEKQAQNLLSFVKEVRENPRHLIAHNQAALAVVLKRLAQADDALKLLTTSDEQYDLEFMDNEDKMEVDDEEEEGYGDLVGKASCYVINEKAELKAAKTSEERRRAVVKFGEVSQRLPFERWARHLRKIAWLNEEEYEMRVVKTWIFADLPKNSPSSSELALAGEFALETQTPTFKQSISIPNAGRKIERLDSKAKKLAASDEQFKSDVIGCLDHALQSDESVVIEERYLCPFGCKGDGYSSKTALVNHLKEKHPIGEVELFDCGECDKKGMTKKQLANHKPVHKKVECPYKGLDGCNAKPMTKSNVNRHCELKHSNRIEKSKAKKKKV